MRKIADIIPFAPRYLTNGEWGIEVEVEGKNLPVGISPDDWRIEQDGSLKAAMAYEYVMPKPTDLKGVKKALDVLDAAYIKWNSEVDESIRAGVHVHMNVQQWTVKQLFTFSTVYYILEELLVKYCGPNREGNLFCLRAQDAEQILFALQQALEEKNFRILKTDEYRYASLNYCALFKYGSVEFRAMRGTRDLDAIYEWVEILQELRDNALAIFKDPVDVVVSMSGDGEDWFLRRVLPNKWDKLAFPGYEKAIRRACRRVQVLAFTIDWDTIGRPSKNPFLAQEGF